jgi:hypothetical protein
MGIINAKFDAEFESVEKNAKSSPCRSYGPKVFAYSNKKVKNSIILSLFR